MAPALRAKALVRSRGSGGPQVQDGQTDRPTHREGYALRARLAATCLMAAHLALQQFGHARGGGLLASRHLPHDTHTHKQHM